MKNIITVIKKELMRVFKDKRLIISLLIPGLLIYIMYSFMGNAFTDSDREAREATYKITTVNMPYEIQTILKSDDLGLNANYTLLNSITSDELIEIQENLKNNDIDIILIFDQGFTPNLGEGNEKFNVYVYFNPSKGESTYAYDKVMFAVNAYKDAILSQNNVDYTPFIENSIAVYDEKKAMTSGIASLMPFLILTFLFSGCMAVAPDSIAGEKERGTISTILITPIKRSHLALGKIIALSVLAIISALSSFIGLMLSLPKLMGENVSLNGIFGFLEYFMILLVLVSTVLIIIGLMSVLSSFAKTVKEATMFIMPLMFLSMLIGILAMTNSNANTNLILYFIPLYNSVQSIISILTFEINVGNLLITFISNILYLGICIFVLTKLFNNEKVMFSK